jgi:dienelactone hydrolase
MPGVILLHELGADRHQWYPLTVMMAGRGMAVLAIDLRGHGENPDAKGNPPVRADALAPDDFSKMLSDVRNAVSYLAMKGEIDGGRIGIAGLSLGANLALLAASQSWAAAVQCVIAVSPGLDYDGIKTEDAAKNIPAGKHVYLAAARDDAYSFESATTLHALLAGPKEFMQIESGGHGAKLFSRGLVPQIPMWLATTLVTPYQDKTRTPSAAVRGRRRPAAGRAGRAGGQ